MKGTVLEFLVGYQLANSSSLQIDAIGGLRYLDLDVQLALNVTGAGPGGVSTSVITSSSDDFLDGVVGLRGRAKLDENWFVPFYADVGGGSSDLTWQVFTGVGYAFERTEVTFGYRHAAWEFDNTPLVSDIAFSGPIVSWTYKF
ncbi:MAG: hypothetical protein JXR14_05265 [Paracoccaceae bacterium]